jgi:hypothetical protein
MRRMMVQSQYWQIVCEALPRKNPSQKKRTGAVVEGVGPKFKPQHKKKKKRKEFFFLFTKCVLLTTTLVHYNWPWYLVNKFVNMLVCGLYKLKDMNR